MVIRLMGGSVRASPGSALASGASLLSIPACIFTSVININPLH
ncbi:exported protein of unknown function [Citrobacter amalonaticus]|nr:exported protein of unknown function [Citrobacter amalonaticus]